MLADQSTWQQCARQTVIDRMRSRTLLQHSLAKSLHLRELSKDPLVLLSSGQLAALAGSQKLTVLSASANDKKGSKEDGDVDLVHRGDLQHHRQHYNISDQQYGRRA